MALPGLPALTVATLLTAVSHVDSQIAEGSLLPPVQARPIHRSWAGMAISLISLIACCLTPTLSDDSLPLQFPSDA